MLRRVLRNRRRPNTARDLGELTTLHQLGHAKKRKSRAEFDVHERYNDIADGLTHQTNNSMPVYTSFARDYTVHTAL